VRHEDRLLIEALIAVGWADDGFSTQEHAFLDAALEIFEATEDEFQELHDFAGSRRSLADIPIASLSVAYRRKLLDLAVVLTHIDGEPIDAERRIIDELVDSLGIDGGHAAAIAARAEERAQRLVTLL
jgi:tellurite resistance protein